jgi:hypothetical protein
MPKVPTQPPDGYSPPATTENALQGDICLPAAHEALEALAFASYAAELGDAGACADALIAAAHAAGHAFAEGSPTEAAFALLVAVIGMATTGEDVTACFAAATESIEGRG